MYNNMLEGLHYFHTNTHHFSNFARIVRLWINFIRNPSSLTPPSLCFNELPIIEIPKPWRIA